MASFMHNHQGMIHGRIFKGLGKTVIGTGLAAAITLVFIPKSSADSALQASIKTEGDTTNLQFSGRENWEYKVERTQPKVIELTVPAVSQESLGKLIQFEDPWIEKVESLPAESPDLAKFKITLKSPDVEHFDYLTDQPSRLVIDIYKKEKAANADLPKVANAPDEGVKPKSVVTSLPDKKKSSKEKPTSLSKYKVTGKDRKPAASELIVAEEVEAPDQSLFQFLQGIYDSGDANYKRFQIKDYEIREEAIIAAKNNIYIRFPILKLPATRLEYYQKNPPEFVIEPKATLENKEARLLMTLFENKRWAAFLKTYEYYEKKYPQSQYEEIIKHLAAEVHYQLWLRDKQPVDYKAFNDLLNYVTKKFKDSPLSERTEMRIASHDLERGSGLDTLQRYQDLLKKYPESKERDWIKKGIAEGYLILNKYDEALSTYEDLEKNYVQESGGMEATYRKGDVFFQKKDFPRAVEMYKAAIKKLPNQQSIFPNAYYNMAESQFWIGDYRESLDNFLTFIRLYPSNSYGGFALTRIGELLSILGADEKKVLGAYLESQFRFQGSDGAKIARIRTLSQRMAGMRDAELSKTEKEFYEIAESTNLPKIQEFVTLMRAEGYHHRGEYKKAYQGLIDYYQKNPTTTNLAFFKTRIVSYIADGINQKVMDNQFIEALKDFDTLGKTWILNHGRFDIPFLQARAYEQAGLTNDAEVIYQDLLVQLKRIKGTQEEKERRVTEHFPTSERVNLRLAAVLKSQRRYGEALQSISRIEKDDGFSTDEKIEKIEIASNLFELRGEPKMAIQYLRELKKTWATDKNLVSQVNLRLAKQQLNINDPKESLNALNEIEESSKAKEITMDKEFHKRLLNLRAEALVSDRQPVAAVETYLQLFREFESAEPMPGLRFKAGKILFDQGDVHGAEKIWAQIKGPSSEVYQKLARERLSDVKWQDDYKRYIERIPATKDMGSELNGRVR